MIAKLEGTAERLLVDHAIPISNPAFQVLGNELDLATLMPHLAGSGNYVMRVLREAQPLAQGSFAIIP